MTDPALDEQLAASCVVWKRLFGVQQAERLWAMNLCLDWNAAMPVHLKMLTKEAKAGRYQLALAHFKLGQGGDMQPWHVIFAAAEVLKEENDD